jgi:colanic acid biosynthesis glycosyl transferase WcaI
MGSRLTEEGNAITKNLFLTDKTDVRNRDARIRVVFVSISFDPEPGAVMGLPFAKYLQGLGNYDVTVLTAIPWYPIGKRYPGYKLRFHQWEVLDGIRILRIPLYPSHDQSAFRRMLTYLSFTVNATILGLPRLGPVDVVYYFDSLPTTGFLAFLIRIWRGAASVQHIGDLWPDTVLESGMLPYKLRRVVRSVVGGWCKFLYRRHHAITVASPGLRRMLLERDVPDNKVSVVHTWAFESMFFPAAADPQAASEMNSENRFTVLYAGNLGPLQGLETVIDAAALLQEHTNIQIVLVGSGQTEAALQKRVAELGLKNVHFLGRRPLGRMNAFNATADALLIHLRDIPLMRSTTPSKTQVAMASARPILMGVAGDAADLLREAAAGIAFAPENPVAMADAILQLSLLSRKEREEMGKAGRRYYEQTMSLSVGSARLARLIGDAALAARRTRASHSSAN